MQIKQDDFLGVDKSRNDWPVVISLVEVCALSSHENLVYFLL